MNLYLNEIVSLFQSSQFSVFGEESMVMAGCTPFEGICEVEGCLETDFGDSACVKCCESNLCNEGANEESFYGSATALSSLLSLFLPFIFMLLK